MTLAERADLSVGAIKNLEGGKGSSLSTLIRVLRVLDRTDWLESLAPPITVSPLQMLAAKRATAAPRRRASPRRVAQTGLPALKGRSGPASRSEGPLGPGMTALKGRSARDDRHRLMAYVPVDVVEVLAGGAPRRCRCARSGVGVLRLRVLAGMASSRYRVGPTTMPTTTARYVFPTLPPLTFHRLPAMLADSLPDDFGNALTTAYLVNAGVAADAITPLDRLAYLASRGTGALEFRPSRGPRHRKSTALELSELVGAARDVVVGTFDDEDGINDALKHLIAVGTSAGGARAKAVVAWNPATKEVRSGQVPTDPGFEHWLLKLDGVGADVDLGESSDYGRIEYAYHRMATAAGITMTDCRLLHEGARSHFMTRRFDRAADGTKIHMQTLCALAHLDFRLVPGARLRAALRDGQSSRPRPRCTVEAYRRMLFNVASRTVMITRRTSRSSSPTEARGSSHPPTTSPMPTIRKVVGQLNT